MDAWTQVKLGLIKKEPSFLEEVLQQPLFDNDFIPLLIPNPLRQATTHIRRAITTVGCSCINNFWNASCGNWKEFGMIRIRRTQKTIMLIMVRKNFIASIPWNLKNEFACLTEGDLTLPFNHMARPNWVYKVVENLVNSIKVQEFNVCKDIGHIFIIPCELFVLQHKALFV
jgi:hypothetical protein